MWRFNFWIWDHAKFWSDFASNGIGPRQIFGGVLLTQPFKRPPKKTFCQSFVHPGPIKCRRQPEIKKTFGMELMKRLKSLLTTAMWFQRTKLRATGTMYSIQSGGIRFLFEIPIRQTQCGPFLAP